MRVVYILPVFSTMPPHRAARSKGSPVENPDPDRRLPEARRSWGRKSPQRLESIPGVAEIYAPTIAELQATGDLDQGFQPVSLLNGLPYVVALSRTPAGCTPPACDISGLVYIRGAITDPSTGAPQPL